MKNILVINAGSSSLKFAVFQQPLHEGVAALYRGQVDGIGELAKIVITDALGQKLVDARIDTAPTATIEEQHRASLSSSLSWLDTQNVQLAGVGHRVVHGGDKFNAPVKLSTETIAQLEALTTLAPLHQPHNLRPMHSLAARFPNLPSPLPSSQPMING